MKLVLVCGPWSSGTTAVSGMLEHLGLSGIPPYFPTNDKRMRNSYESMAFRDAVTRIASEDTLKMLVDHKEAVAILTQFRDTLQAAATASGRAEQPIFLKYPLSAMLIPHICRVFDTRLVYVIRPLQDIEATRVRRGWPENFGSAGAQVLYSAMMQIYVNQSFPTLMIRYPELLSAPKRHARMLAAWCGIPPDSPGEDAAVEFVKTHIKPKSK